MRGCGGEFCPPRVPGGEQKAGKVRVLLKGLKLGMLLQLAVGPVCLFVFALAGNQGFLNAEPAVLAVTLVDAAYIGLALLGMIAFLQHKITKRILQWLGAGVLLFYGVQALISFCGWFLGWKITLGAVASHSPLIESPFWQGIFLTASNPLTILFWAGVLTVKVTEEGLTKTETFIFGLGCVMATLVFLTGIAYLGTLTRCFLPQMGMRFLNGTVGLLLIYFAGRMAGAGIKTEQPRETGKEVNG